MNNETKKPLYKVLDEKRSKGGWYLGNDYRYLLNDDTEDFFYLNPNMGVAKPEKSEADANHLVLAANNLSNLAEAPNMLVDDFTDMNGQVTQASINKAKEALQRIS